MGKHAHPFLNNPLDAIKNGSLHDRYPGCGKRKFLQDYNIDATVRRGGENVLFSSVLKGNSIMLRDFVQ